MIKRETKDTRTSFFHPKTNEYWIKMQVFEHKIKIFGVTLYSYKSEYDCDHDVKTNTTGFK